MDHASRCRDQADRSSYGGTEPPATAPGRGPIQAKTALAVGRGELIGPAAPAAPVDAAPGAAPGAGRALPGAVRNKMEAAFGADFSSVRVHEDAQPAALGAHAFARGEHLHFAPGRFDPDGHAGQELIGHELTHVVQQRAGRVATPMGKGGVNADPALEAEADQMGARAARGEAVGGVTAAPRGAGGGAAGDGPAQLRTAMSAERVGALQPGAHGGWRWVSGGGDTHVTIFLNDESVQRLRERIDARDDTRIRRLANNRLDMTTVPDDFRLYYDEFHVTIDRVHHYYYSDAGMPLANNAIGAASPAFDDAGWAEANREAARVLGFDRYALNQNINGLGGHLPVSAEDELRIAQERAAALLRQQQERAAQAVRNEETAKQFGARGMAAILARKRANAKPAPPPGRGSGQVKRKLEPSSEGKQDTEKSGEIDIAVLDESCRPEVAKHQRRDRDDPDPDGDGRGDSPGTAPPAPTGAPEILSQ